MIADLQRYPEYRDSGMSWLGEVPKHWHVRRLRNVAEMRVSNVDKHSKEGELPVRLCNYSDVYKNDLIRDRGTFMSATASAEEVARFRIELDDVLITKDSESWNDIGVPALVRHSAPDLLCGYHLAILRPLRNVVSGSFLFRVFQSHPVSYQCHVEANGVTRYGLSHPAINSLWVPLPTSDEQIAIVRYLDYMDRRIQRYVRAKQKLIKLLEEQKQAIIQRAVTRGLNPNVRLKPSGVDWLGEIPEHWEIRKLGHLFALHGSGTTPAGDQHFGGSIPWVMTGDLKDSLILETKRTVTFEAVSELAALRLYPPGSLVVAMYGATIGKTGILNVEACTNQACCVLARPRREASVRYLQSVVRVGRKELIRKGYGGGQPNINAEIVRMMRVPVPPRSEQDSIVLVLQNAIESLDHSVNAAHDQISLMREYRTRLIADVVTGKLDSREVASKLPEEEPEDEALVDDASLEEGSEESAEFVDELEEIEA